MSRPTSDAENAHGPHGRNRHDQRRECDIARDHRAASCRKEHDRDR